MSLRWFFLCSALLLCASVASGAGTYQRTRDGKTLVWNDSPKRGMEATWSGKRDKNGYATGSGTLTWYKVEQTIVTGSNIPDARRHPVVISRYSGEMVRGKIQGPESAARTSPSPRQTATPRPTASPATPTPAPGQTTMPTPRATATATPEQTPTPATQQTPTPIPEQTATPTPDQEAREQADLTRTKEPPIQVDESLRSLAVPPSMLPKQNAAEASPHLPPPSTPPVPSATPPGVGDDVHIVATLDQQYQAAVKSNDAATMDRILADDFVLVTGRGSALTKADLLKEAREKRTIYEHQEEEEGTQRVRVWGDTAVVTALLRIKGTRDQKPLDYKVWFSDTYVRTPAGWRYAFGQASTPLSKPDAR